MSLGNFGKIQTKMDCHHPFLAILGMVLTGDDRWMSFWVPRALFRIRRKPVEQSPRGWDDGRLPRRPFSSAAAGQMSRDRDGDDGHQHPRKSVERSG